VTAPWRRQDRQAGLTLVELLVTMVVSSVLLLAVGAVFTGSLTSAKGVSSRSEATASARLAMDTLQRRLRVAVRPSPKPPTEDTSAMFTLLGPDRVSFYSSIAPAGALTVPPPTLVEYLVDTTARCLRESLTPGVAVLDPVTAAVTSYTWPVAGRRSRCLVFGTFNTDGAPLFVYYDSAVAATPLTVGAGSTDPVLLRAVHSVELSMTAHDVSNSSVRATPVRTRVSLVNRLNDDSNSGVTP
jgi:prepilin-type N-terminal cleavage/methylation domain-containing protein